MRTLLNRSFSLSFAALVFGMFGPFAHGHEPTEQLRDVDDNTWLLVDRGGVTSSLQMMAYSSGWYDPDAHQFCIFGGGHFNYSGNEVWCFDIGTLTWHELYPADVVADPPYTGRDQGGYVNFDNEDYPGALFNPAGESIDDARPFSRHTYDQLEYISGLGALMWGGFAWGDSDSPWCTQCRDTWLFNFKDRNWSYLYNGKNPSPNVSPGVGASAYASRDNILFAKVFSETWTFDPETNQWRKIGTRGAPPWTIEGTLEYDAVHNNLYFFGGNYNANLSLWKFSIQKRAWDMLKPDGDGPASPSSSGPGVAYDSTNDTLLIYFGGTIWAYEPSRNSWTTLRPEFHPSDTGYVFGRFRYDPVNNGFWLHAPDGEQHTTWFYRYKN